MARSSALAPYVAAVTVVAAVLAQHVALRTPLSVPHHVLELLAFAVLLVASELKPLSLERPGEEPEGVSLSGLFALALILQWDVGLVILVQAAATLLHGALHRVAWWKRVFNLAQYTCALVAAASVLHLVAPGTSRVGLDTAHLVGALLAAATYFVVNNTLMAAAVSLLQGSSLWAALVDDLTLQASVNGAAAVLAPLTLVVANANLLLLPSLLVPLMTVQRAASLMRQRERRAQVDDLTGLANTHHFRELVREAIDQAPPVYGRLALLMIDLDDFAEVNDTLGHEIGDVLLSEFAQRLVQSVGERGTVGRFGGDEFAVLLPGLSWTEAEAAAEALLRTFEGAFDVAELSFELRASIGVAVYPRDGDDAERLVQHADVALALAKRTGAGVEVYSAERDWHSPRRLRLLGELRQAIELRQLELHYQPKADLRTGTVLGFEALLRWPHPELGRIAPEEFIGLAERSGLIREVTRYVLNEAARTASGWRDAGIDLPISVNISGRDLDDPDLPDKVAQLLTTWSIPATSLVLEITETALMAEPERAFQVLRALRQLGIRISMDDFGTGYASLALLKRLPVDEIKIDRLFVSDLARSTADAAIVRAVVGLARHLEIEVVAEGVENAEVWSKLIELGCVSAQGFYIGRPKALRHLDFTAVQVPIPTPRVGDVISLTARAGAQGA